MPGPVALAALAVGNVVTGGVGMVVGAALVTGGYLLVKHSAGAAHTAQTVQTVATIGCLGYALNAGLNGLIPTDFDVSAFLDDSDVITAFYSRYSGLTHGWVVLYTNSGQAFMCHLLGIPSKLFVRVETSKWAPGNNKVKTLKQKLEWRLLKKHIKVVISDWGHYTLGVRDCRHFAEDVDKYLSRHC